MISMVHEPSTQPPRPIYGPNDPRWSALETWLLREAGGPIETLYPSERAYFYASAIEGLPHSECHGSSFPEFPLQPAPVWADGHGPTMIDDETEEPELTWERRLASAESIDVQAIASRTDTFAPDAGVITHGEMHTELWVGGTRILVELWGADELRELSAVILAAAEARTAIDIILRGERP